MKSWRSELHYILQLHLRLGLVLVFFSFFRIVFYLANSSHFPAVGTASLMAAFLYGIRFDISAVLYVNLLLILSYLLPIPYRSRKWYQVGQKSIFLIFNSIAFVFEIADVALFPFTFRRANLSDLSLFGNTIGMLPTLLLEYWYLTLAGTLLVWFISYLYNKSSLQKTPARQNPWLQFALLAPALVYFGIGLRGGLQLRPLSPSASTEYVKDMRLAPLISNTTLGFIFSSQQRLLEEKHDFQKAELDQLFPLYVHPKPGKPFSNQNVVIIALESFGKEYSSLFNDFPGAMPFLDSLIREGYFCENSYANGLRSTQGIVSITAGIPALMEDPLMFSAYQSNRVDGLAALLRKKGYQTGFFHGSNPGSMEFERFARLTGFEHFYDRTAYNHDIDYDGQWGIWDLPFLQYFANGLNAYQQPFLGFVFTLTSHHPYKVEKWFEDQYPKEDPLLRSVRYTDYSLRKFFETASHMPWFKNTLFVISADHIGASTHPRYQTREGKYRIPILFFKPGAGMKSWRKQVCQQSDILPSVLDYLGYDLPYSSFGTSVFDTLHPGHYAYMYSENTFQILDKEYILLYDGKQTTGLFHYPKDTLMQENLKGTLPEEEAHLERQLKAAIQRHNDAMLHNRLVEENER